MSIRPIRTKKDYQNALNRIDQLMSAKRNTQHGDELHILVTLVEAYEVRRMQISSPDPIAAIMHRMEALNLTRKDLEAYIGSRARVSEVLGGKRPLTLAMVRKLHKHLAIPAEVLIAA